MDIQQLHDQAALQQKTGSVFGSKNENSILEPRYTLPDLYPIRKLSQKMDNVLNVSSKIRPPMNTVVTACTPPTATNEADKKKTKPPKELPYKIEVITPADNTAVLAMLKRFFFKDEPLNDFLKLGDCTELEEYSLKCIPEACSFKAVHNNGEIIGVFLNCPMRRPSKTTEQNPPKEIQHASFNKIGRLMDYIERTCDVFSVYPETDVILDGKILSVNSNYRGMGIARQLTARSLEYMREHNIPVMHVLCSSHISAQVMEREGFHEIWRIKYSDYKVDGKVVFAPKPPHLAARVMVKEIAPVVKCLPRKQTQ